MSQHYGDYEDLLRGALHAAVDSAEPADDGLERIRARLTTPHPLPVAWLMAVCSWVARRARGSLDSVSAWLQTVPGEVHRRGGAAEGRYTERLRLVATVAAVTVLLAISVSALTPFGRHVISQAGSALNSIGGGAPAPTGGPGGSGPRHGRARGTPAPNLAPDMPPPAPHPRPSGTPAHTPTPSPPPPAPPGTSAPPASPHPAGPAPASPPPASPGPSSSSPVIPAGTGPDSTGPSSPPAASPAPAANPGLSPPSAGAGGSAGGCGPSAGFLHACPAPPPGAVR